jgi:hypothetical protein
MKIHSVGAAVILVGRKSDIPINRGYFRDYANVPKSGLRSGIMYKYNKKVV